jgi:hypothetical protein
MAAALLTTIYFGFLKAKFRKNFESGLYFFYPESNAYLNGILRWLPTSETSDASLALRYLWLAKSLTNIAGWRRLVKSLRDNRTNDIIRGGEAQYPL